MTTALKLTIGALLLVVCSGCAFAPNGWNLTIYQQPYGKPIQAIAFGISGPIPPPKYLLPQNWNKAP